MKKKFIVIATIILLALVLTVAAIVRINKPHIKADKVTKIVSGIRFGESKEITDKNKINEIVNYVNSQSYIPAIFIPKCMDDFEIYFYSEGTIYAYYTYGYEIMHANDSVYRSKADTGEKLKELTGF